ncbi:MAG: DMT family transporter [Granulosicoccaceae bacterium]
MNWITLTLFAALMQSVRTAGQKELATHVSAVASTHARYLFGLPFALIYLYVVLQTHADEQWQLGARFYIYASAAATAQILATACLVSVLAKRNFAVGTAFAKTEALITAVLAAVLFAEYLSWIAWLSVLIGIVGVLMLNKSLVLSDLLRGGMSLSSATTIGIASGVFFSFTSLFLRQASLSLNVSPILAASITLAYMVCMQTLISGAWVWLEDKQQFKTLAKTKGLCTFIGVTSVLGSIGWFTAMTMQFPALVKALGQIEFIFAVILSGQVFKERNTSRELLGMFCIVSSVVILMLSRFF